MPTTDDTLEKNETISKVEKLIALATDDGAEEAEKRNAALKACELIREAKLAVTVEGAAAVKDDAPLTDKQKKRVEEYIKKEQFKNLALGAGAMLLLNKLGIKI